MFMEKTKASILVKLWLICGIILIFSMVLIGGITRLTNSGLSITEWDLFSEINPFALDENLWESEFEKYKNYQEFREYNAHYTINDFKNIFWWEYIHRMLGRLIGVVFIFPYIFFTLKNYFNLEMHKKLLLVLFMGAFQGFLGWFMVESGLSDKPAISHFRLAAHLITAFITCAYTYWVFLTYSKQKKYGFSNNKVLKWVNLSLLILVIQIILGALVAGLKAGKIFNTFPKMGDYWIAPQVFNSSLFESMIGVQFLHRYNAYLVGAIIVITSFKMRKSLLPEFNIRANVLAILLVLQILVGVFTLLYQVPIVLALAHQVIAFILLMFLINIKYVMQK